MKTVSGMQKFTPQRIRFESDALFASRPVEVMMQGEYGYRIVKNLERIECNFPYSSEYLLSQVFAGDGEWSNFPKFHGDIAGRWILAETYAHAAGLTPPDELCSLVETMVQAQNPDGSFGIVSFEEKPINMPKAYGNGWMLLALSQYALTFKDPQVKAAAVRLGNFYERTFEVWKASGLSEDETGFYASTISSYYHAISGLARLYRLTGDARYLNLVSEFLPHLVPLEEADHSHMHLSIRNGLADYYRIGGNRAGIEKLAQEMQVVADRCLFETAGVPERYWRYPDLEVDDEACSSFDWLILTLKMHDLTGDKNWLWYAILTLENHLFYNQMWNGGFGAYIMGGKYLQQGKEATWCCSLYGPYGLIEAVGLLVAKRGNILEINHLCSGEFSFGDGQIVLIEKNDRLGRFTVDASRAKDITCIHIFHPPWLDFKTDETQPEGDVAAFELDGTRVLEIAYSYRLWISRPNSAPKQVLEAVDGQTVTLFYGPWLLCHRYNEPVETYLEVDAQGFVQNYQAEQLLGLGFYGESTRIRLPADLSKHPEDVLLAVGEQEDELWLYPLNSKESPSHGNAHICIKKAGA